jgi:hypothetical protein
MADDVDVTPGTGATVAMQERTGARKFQQVIPAGADTILSGRVTVTTTAAEAIAARSNRVGVQLLALATNTAIIDVGDTTVASGSEFPLNPGDSIYLPTEDAIWADAASGSQTLAYIEYYD